MLDRAGVKAKFDVFPEQIIDYLALVGDSSDNIPGIDKVGPKTARQVARRSTAALDDLVAHAAEITGKVGENLRAGLATLELSRKLATIRTDLELPLSLEELTPRRAGHRRAARAVHALRAACAAATARRRRRRHAGRRRRQPAAPRPRADARRGRQRRRRRAAARRAIERHYETVTSWAQLRALAGQRCARRRLFAFDTETTSLDYMKAEIVGVSFCIEPGVAAYVPLATTTPARPRSSIASGCSRRSSRCSRTRSAARSATTSSTTRTCWPNHGIAAAPACASTPCWSPTSGTASRPATTWIRPRERYLGITHHHVRGRRRQGRQADLTFNQVPVETAAEYAAEDADVTLRLHQALWPQLRAVPRAGSGSTRRSSSRWCRCCCAWSTTACSSIASCCARRAARSRSAAAGAAAAGAHARPAPNSTSNRPKQLQQILFEKLQIPVTRKTPTGQPSTAEDVLEELARVLRAAAHHPRVPRARQAEIHLHRQAAGADRTSAPGASTPPITRRSPPTGRLSSADPNLQNIPIRRAGRAGASARPSSRRRATCCWRPTIRRSSCASWRTCRATKACCAAFAEDRDVHQATAAEVFGVPLRRGDCRSAPHRQDHQLRAHLRHVAPSGSRASSASTAAPRRSTWSAISRAIRA